MYKYVCLALVGVLTAGSFTPAAAQEGKDTPADRERQLLLETVGLLATSQVYQGYLNVGLVADGKAAGTYSDKAARQIIESVLALMDASDKNLEKIGKLELTKEDRAGVYKLRQLNGLIRRQAAILQEY